MSGWTPNNDIISDLQDARERVLKDVEGKRKRAIYRSASVPVHRSMVIVSIGTTDIQF
ncbi:hypothetical protein ACFSGI_08970 [Paenibacillus nicotianae]|uniref:Uncharacterized protein n=1 Tax=Paenibacillus nicotianae TaxID=1526551 RepID=A0ABW4UTX0_9BACL